MARASTTKRRITALQRRVYAAGVSRSAALIAVVVGLIGAGLLGTTTLIRGQNSAESKPAESKPADEKTASQPTAAGQKTAGEKPAAGGKIVGIVRDADGKPLSGVLVQIVGGSQRSEEDGVFADSYPDFGKRGSTDPDGRFRIEPLDTDVLSDLLVVIAGYRAKVVKRVDPLAEKVVEIELTAWKIPDDPACVVHGIVLDPDGKPAVDATLQTDGWEGELPAFPGAWPVFGSPPEVDRVAVTDAAGKFMLISPAPLESLNLVIHLDGLARQKFNLVPTGAKENRLTLARGATIKGRVVRDGQAVASVELGVVQVDRSSETCLGGLDLETDAEGRFSLVAPRPIKI